SPHPVARQGLVALDGGAVAEALRRQTKGVLRCRRSLNTTHTRAPVARDARACWRACRGGSVSPGFGVPLRSPVMSFTPASTMSSTTTTTSMTSQPGLDRATLSLHEHATGPLELCCASSRLVR